MNTQNEPPQKSTNSIWMIIGIIVVIILIVAMIIIYFGTKNQQPKATLTSTPQLSTLLTPTLSPSSDISLPSSWQACKNNDDCTITQSNCCGCSMGGAQVGIKKKYLDQWTKQISENCTGVMCPAMYSCDNKGTIVCNTNKKCEFKPSGQAPQ